jgi:alkanesulfonate monooxygenase SsuD/methylene tetrahydromethanopterin reductase-like flavin-dependent oxidoreductase (luciferase family)
MLKIGVRLSRQFEDAGEYLADARALDAAGVDSLWLDDHGYDPWLVVAWLAAVTGRARLVVPVAAREVQGQVQGPEPLRARVETLDRLSRGRAALTVPGGAAEADVVAALIEVARRARGCVIVQVSTEQQARVAARLADGLVGFDESLDAFTATVKPIARWRERDGPSSPFELWASMKMPGDREEWRQMLDAYQAAGASGVIVPADPRLLDLLRNSDEDDDRSDLTLAQG